MFNVSSILICHNFTFNFIILFISLYGEYKLEDSGLRQDSEIGAGCLDQEMVAYPSKKKIGSQDIRVQREGYSHELRS